MLVNTAISYFLNLKILSFRNLGSLSNEVGAKMTADVADVSYSQIFRVIQQTKLKDCQICRTSLDFLKLKRASDASSITFK